MSMVDENLRSLKRGSLALPELRSSKGELEYA